MIDNIVAMKIGHRLVRMRLTRWADGESTMSTVDDDSGNNGKARIIGHGRDGSVLRRVTRQDVKEKNLP